MKEQGIQAKIIKFLKAQGHYSINVITASRSGVSDIISCSPIGGFWSVEVKKPGEKPSKLQEWNLRQVSERNGTAFWADSYGDFLVKYNKAAILKANR